MGAEKNLRKVVEEQRGTIMKIPGVIGIAVGQSRSKSGEPCILVYTTGQDWPRGLPYHLEGYTVEIDTKSKGFKAL